MERSVRPGVVTAFDCGLGLATSRTNTTVAFTPQSITRQTSFAISSTDKTHPNRRIDRSSHTFPLPRHIGPCSVQRRTETTTRESMMMDLMH